MWYIYVMEFYSAVKKNEIIKLAGKWAGLEFVILNEVTPTQEDNSVCSLSHADLSLICIYVGVSWDIDPGMRRRTTRGKRGTEEVGEANGTHVEKGRRESW